MIGNNQADTVRVLVEAGADISRRNEDGRTSLDLSERPGHREVIIGLYIMIDNNQTDAVHVLVEAGMIQPEG